MLISNETNLKQESPNCGNFPGLVGESKPLGRVLRLVNIVAPSPSTVLILGETGTGKELVAKALHEASPRKNNVMIKVNCATLPANLIESELFGHERGSFTGATDKRVGKFELANNSTLFLDEIGELPLGLQVKLLRALQEKEIERIGGKIVIKTDVRIIAATNRDLTKEVQAGNFRQDLFFRLNVFPIEIPPLRERRDDIPLLATHFLAQYAKKTGKKLHGFSSKVIKELTAYHWPGNIRELEHLVERGVLMTSGPIVDEIDVPGSDTPYQQHLNPEGRIKTIAEIEKEHIVYVLKTCRWKISGIGGAAHALRIPPTTLNSKIKRLGISKEYNDD